MSAGQSRPCRFEDELAAIVARRKSLADASARHELFEALSGLEKRALIGDASDRTLRNIAEARFLTGILRDAMQPPRRASLRTMLRMRRKPGARPLAAADPTPV